MDEFIKMLDKNLDYLGHETPGDTVIIHVVSNRKDVQCPYCGAISSKKHST